MSNKKLILLFEDRKRLDELYKKLYPSVENYVLNNSGSTQDAKDIFQESLIVTYKKVLNPDFKLTSSIDTFIYAVAKNKWLNALRSSKEMVDIEDLEFDDDLDINQILTEQDKRSLYMTHFKKLSEGCRYLFEYFFKGMSMENIASAMNLGSAGYVRKKKHHCQEKLITAIKNDPLYTELKNG